MELSKFKLIGYANDIADIIWDEVIVWDYFCKDTIGEQLVRAADSISSNLSKAYENYTIPKRIRFVYYSRGSLCETINWIQKSKKRKLISTEIANKLLCSLDTLSIKQNKYLISLKSAHKKNS
jgi:four helix bundle protein